ncbi:Uncharacterised protein [Serratia rubidaea]|nr:Uncharacterised protein [Serratia rubidaea]
MTGDIIAPYIQPAVDIITHPLGRFAPVEHRADAGQVGDKLAGTISNALFIRHAELLRNILLGIEHPRPVDRLTEVNHPPAVQRINPRIAHIGGGSLQHRRHLRAGHIREALHQHRNAAGNVRRSHRSTAVLGVAGGQIVRRGAFNHRAVDLRARRRDAEAGGVAAAGREGADRVITGALRILQAGDRQPVRRDIRHKVGQPGHGIGVIQVIVITGGKDGDDAAARRINRSLIGATRLSAQDLFDLFELFTRVVDGKVRIGRVGTALGKLIGNADPPAVVDNSCAAGNQRIPAGLVYRPVVAKNNAVFRARVTVLRADDLRIEGHTVHFSAVTVAGGNTTDVRTVRT